jgi:hypothetical protein
VHSLIFSFTLQSSKPFHPATGGVLQSVTQVSTTTVDGMWWKQETNVTGFVSLANTTARPKPVKVEVSDNANVLAAHSIVVSPHGTKILDLAELQAASGSEGGIRITYDGTSTDVLINGGLEDQSSGYSAVLPFTHDLPTATKTSQISVSELGLMVGAADPMMSFPPATRFTPYSVVRNVSDEPASLTPTIWWMEAGAPHSALLPKFTALPRSSRTVDVMSLLAGAGLKDFNGSIHLVFDVEGTAGGLLMAAGSVDQGNTYVFEVIPRGILESVSKSLSYWNTANGNDTMVNLWNPADEPQDFVFRLSFSGGHYGYPIHLEPRASRMFNISEIIQNQVPDAEGNIVPASVHDGGAAIEGSGGENEHILVAMDAGTYNVRKATCGLYCQTCNGATLYSIVDNPFSVAVGGQKQQTFHVQYNTGQQYTSGAHWSSNNTSLATVGAGTGLVLGVSPGGPMITGVDGYTDPNYVYYWCEGSWWSCPLTSGGSANSPGTVTPDHLLVISDVTSVLCTTNSTVRRIIKYWEVDVNGNQVGTISTKEQFASKGANSCNTTISTSETCSPDTGGQLQDAISVGCNSVGGSCGTTFTKQQWLYCPSTGSPVVFATPGNLVIHNNAVTVGGSSQFAAGTRIGPNGVF